MGGKAGSENPIVDPRTCDGTVQWPEEVTPNITVPNEPPLNRDSIWDRILKIARWSEETVLQTFQSFGRQYLREAKASNVLFNCLGLFIKSLSISILYRCFEVHFDALSNQLNMFRDDTSRRSCWLLRSSLMFTKKALKHSALFNSGVIISSQGPEIALVVLALCFSRLDLSISIFISLACFL